VSRLRIDDVKHALIWIAVLLMIIWVIARVTLAVTSLALHILWIVALILIIIWLIGRVTGKG
jgi:hypothetical protein